MVRLVDTSTGESYRPNRLTLTILHSRASMCRWPLGLFAAEYGQNQHRRHQPFIRTRVPASRWRSGNPPAALPTDASRCGSRGHRDRQAACSSQTDFSTQSIFVVGHSSRLTTSDPGHGSFDHRPVIGSAARATAAVVFLLALAVGGFLLRFGSSLLTTKPRQASIPLT